MGTCDLSLVPHLLGPQSKLKHDLLHETKNHTIQNTFFHTWVEGFSRPDRCVYLLVFRDPLALYKLGVDVCLPPLLEGPLLLEHLLPLPLLLQPGRRSKVSSLR